MQSPKAVSIHSDGYLEIGKFFKTTPPPYNLGHIDEFNRLYQRIYPGLNGTEKRKAEDYVDYLIKHVEQPDWISRIYGVV